MTYDSLASDILKYSERPADAALTTAFPRLLMIVENKLAAKLKTLGIQQVATSTLDASVPTIAKPSFWRDTVSFTITDNVTQDRTALLMRSYEFCREYSPIQSVTGKPRYYSDYDYDNFFLAVTPSVAYQFEILYHPRLNPLSAEQQVNWFTQNAPQLLLYGCMQEAQLFLKNYERAALFGGLYEQAVTELSGEDVGRHADRTTTTVK